MLPRPRFSLLYLEFVLFDQASPRQMCEEFVRGGSAQMNRSAQAPHVVTVLSIFDATPPTSCLVSSSLCNEYSPQNPAYLDLFLQQVANFCLPSMLRDRATGQRQPFPKQRSEVASKSLQCLRQRPGLGGHPITQLPIFNLLSFVHFSPCHQGGEHHRLLHLLSGLSSSSVIDSNGRRTKRKKFRRKFRHRAHTSSADQRHTGSRLPKFPF